MKVLSLHPVEATLVALKVKRVETRPWQAPSLIGQRFAIAATAEIPGMRRGDVRRYGAFTVERDDPPGCAPTYLLRGSTLAWPYRLPTGAIVATTKLEDIVPIIGADECEWHSEHERGVGPCAHAASDGQVIVHTPDKPMHTTVVVELAYGDFSPGGFAWLLADADRVNPVVPFKGGQGLTKTWEPA